MELILPISGVVKPDQQKSATSPLGVAQGSSIALPLRFIVTGLAALCLAIAWLALQPISVSSCSAAQRILRWLTGRPPLAGNPSMGNQSGWFRIRCW